MRSALLAPALAGPGLSLETARALGRRFGGLGFNRKRLERASGHIARALPDLDSDQRRELALRGYEHLAMLAVEVAFLPRLLTADGWIDHVEIGRLEEAMGPLVSGDPMILITGHTGNWEILGGSLAILGFPIHALYRPLDLAPLDAWVRRTRERRGLVLLDKFGAADRLPGLLDRGVPIGVVADQNAGDRGLFVPFFGRLVSTYKSVGLLAQAHRAWIICGQARRLGWDEGEGGLAAIAGRRVGGPGLRYRIDIVDVIPPGACDDHPDPVFALTARYRRAIERMVLAAPEQYLWMHRIWKSRPRHERDGKPFPPRLREKLAALPWMDDTAVEGVVEQSGRDRAFLQEHGLTRLP